MEWGVFLNAGISAVGEFLLLDEEGWRVQDPGKVYKRLLHHKDTDCRQSRSMGNTPLKNQHFF